MKTTLDIKTIEKKLGKQVRQDAVAIGFDNAENLTGVCILRTDKEKIHLEHLQIITSNMKDDHFHKADRYVDSLNKFKQNLTKYKQHKILIVERCFFGRNVESLIHLAHFGILTYITLKDSINSYYYFGATTARSIIGFNQKKQKSKCTIKAKTYTRDTKNKKGKILHRKGEKKKISCKELVHDYLKTDFEIIISQPDEADAFVLALAGLLQ